MVNCDMLCAGCQDEVFSIGDGSAARSMQAILAAVRCLDISINRSDTPFCLCHAVAYSYPNSTLEHQTEHAFLFCIYLITAVSVLRCFDQNSRSSLCVCLQLSVAMSLFVALHAPNTSLLFLT